MHTQTTRRGFTQIIFGKNALFTSPLEGEDVRRTKEGVWNKHVGVTPHPASGHPLPQGARKTTEGFTLLELLIVVLIIGILAAVALPQYQLAVEKARVREAIILLRAIAQANQVYYMTHGTYAYMTELNKLDLTIPGTENTTWGTGRIQTTDWVYSPSGAMGLNKEIARANRLTPAGEIAYYLFITPQNPNTIGCTTEAPHKPTALQQKICAQINQGTF